MTDRLHLRPVGPFDLPLLAELHAACFTADWDQAWSADSFAEILAMPGAAGLLLSAATDHQNSGQPESGGQETAPFCEEPLGFVITRSVVDEMEIILLAVRPDRRGLGLGRYLAAAVIERAAKSSMRALFLEYAALNLSAGSLYRRVGFEQVGLRRNYYRGALGAAIDAVTMRLDLHRPENSG
jgi:[ribosomal protein S18]-alanine N-acetyltransferase